MKVKNKLCLRSCKYCPYAMYKKEKGIFGLTKYVYVCAASRIGDMEKEKRLTEEGYHFRAEGILH